jgi:hypothetical protein
MGGEIAARPRQIPTPLAPAGAVIDWDTSLSPGATNGVPMAER